MSSAITIALVSTAVTTGVSAASANRQAKKQNEMVRQQNADQIMLDMAARGAPIYGANLPADIQGSESAILPYYFGGTERQMADDASAVYRSIRSQDPRVELANYERMLDTYGEANQSNKDLVIDAATGRLVDRRLAESAPVFEARTNVAKSKRNAALEALRDTLSEIDSIQAGKGYSGDSTAKRMMRFNARRQIGSQAAADMTEAELQNQLEVRNIRDSELASRRANLGQADAMTQAEMRRTQLAKQAMADDFNTSISPFSSFNIGTGQFTKPEPLVPPTDIAGALASSIGGTVNTLATNRMLAGQARSSTPQQMQFTRQPTDNQGWSPWTP